jgi:hypothetical protein
MSAPDKHYGGRFPRGARRRRAWLFGLPVGSPAPDLDLPSLTGKGRFRLRNYFGERPVVLIFGSFT